MTIVKNIELMGESSESWEEAARICVEEASKSVRNIQSVWIKDMQAKVEGNTIKSFTVNCKVSFLVDSSLQSSENAGVS